MTALNQLILPVSDRDHIQGKANAPVTLVEYGDYECPFCGQAHSIIKHIQEDMGDELCFVFRNFPLSQIHPHALPTALAAEAAGIQEKFWEMHAILYENQDALEDEDLLAYAQGLKLDMDQFVSDIARDSMKARVREDFMSGIRSGVNGTPTFFINNLRHDGSYDYETLLSVLQRAARQTKTKHNT